MKQFIWYLTIIIPLLALGFFAYSMFGPQCRGCAPDAERIANLKLLDFALDTYGNSFNEFPPIHGCQDVQVLTEYLDPDFLKAKNIVSMSDNNIRVAVSPEQDAYVISVPLDQPNPVLDEASTEERNVFGCSCGGLTLCLDET